MNKKDYKGYELVKAIHDGEIKDGTIIEIHDLSTLDHIKTRIDYSNKRLNWLTGEFDTRCLFDDNIYFRILEDNTKEIEEVNLAYVVCQSDFEDGEIGKILNKFFRENDNKINEIIKVVNTIRKENKK